MEVLKANTQQYEALQGFANHNHIINFSLDADDNYIIGKQILTDDKFLEIRNQLKQLEVIPYNPKETEL
jgi:hypothetical protein